MWILYQLAFAAALLGAGPFLLLARGRHYLPTLPGRLGFHRGRVETRALWLHAVSVGEVGVAATLARILPEGIPLVVTTVTPTGQAQARARLGGRGAVAYLPFDLGLAVRLFFRRFSPRALVLVEGDLWPLVLRTAKRRGLPVLMVNGRIGDRSYARMRRLRPLLGPLLARVDTFGVQSAEDRDRLAGLGVPGERIVVTGNLKFDSPEPPSRPELEERLRGLASGRPILVAGSTMVGEEEQVLAAFLRLGRGEQALLLLAPRHPERWEEVAGLLRARGLGTVRRSELPADGRPEVLLLDSLGELAGLYRLARGAFVGGTLVPTGGHNPLEPARFGVPVAAGPSMANFRGIAREFDRAAAWRRISGPEELSAVWGAWIRDPEAAAALGRRGGELVASHRGALEKTRELLAPVLRTFGEGR